MINKNRSETDSMNKTESIVKSRNDYPFFYVSLILAAFAIGLCRSLLYVSVTIRASLNLYLKMFENVIESPIRFFDSNPIGKILNRFTSDFSPADYQLPIISYMIILVRAKDQIT